MREAYPFSTLLRVRYNETDSQEHVNFVQYFNYFDVALVEYLRHIKFSYAKMLEEGTDFFYVDAHASYHAPAFFDDMLRLHCQVGKIGDSSIRFEFQIFRDGENLLIATGTITAVTVEKDSKQKVSVPENIRHMLAAD